MASVAIWLAILGACFGAGAAALARLRAGCDDLAEEAPYAVALGMGLLGYLMLAAGLLGALQAWVGVALVLAVGLPGARHVVRLAAGVGRLRWSWSAAPLAGFFLAAGLLTLAGALAPAMENDYDGLVYHLAIPKVYLREGAIRPLPWLSHSNFPFTIEMLYLLGLQLRDQSLAKLFHLGCGWLCALAIYSFGRRWWSARAGALGAACFVAIPLVGWQMMVAYNELALALYVFLALAALARWYEGRRAGGGGDGWLWAAGVMCGLALGTKMLAGLLAIFAVVAIGWGVARARLGWGGVWRLAGFVGIAAALAAPWYVRSWVWTGNPVYPFFYEVFGGRWWSPERARLYAQAQAEFGLGAGALAFLALPWRLTMDPRWFFDQPEALRPFNIHVMVFGPLLLSLLPTLPLGGAVGRPGRLALWFALAFTAGWFGLTQNGRYLAPILPALCAAAGLAADRLLDRRGIATAAAAAGLLLGLGSGLWATLLLARPALPVAAGRESPGAYLRRVSPLYRDLEAVNLATPRGARILVLGHEPRLFYLERDYLLGDHAEIIGPEQRRDGESLLAALRGMGVTHVLLDRSFQADVAARSGPLAAALHDLVADGRVRLVRRMEALSLWAVAEGRSAGER